MHRKQLKNTGKSRMVIGGMMGKPGASCTFQHKKSLGMILFKKTQRVFPRRICTCE